jgi:HD-like signal output (HDOD) protein
MNAALTTAAALLIAGAVGFFGSVALRRRGRRGLGIGARSARVAADSVPPIDAGRIEAASDLVSLRLWRLAFGAPAEAPPLQPAHERVRRLILAVLEVDELDPNYFPRRPALMHQLLQAVDDPNAAAEKLSRMIAHDPVLTADVLRLANSSLYRMSAAPIETIQRAIVVCGVDELRGILATAMLRPVFRASRTNFPRLPRMLWDRTERAARAAELYAAKTQPQDRFEAQLLVLLSALGPLAVYSAALHGYSRAPRLTPNPALFVEMIVTLGPQMSQRIARDWQTSPRFAAALEKSSRDFLAGALHLGELLGTLSFLEAQTVLSREDRLDMVKSAGLSGPWVDSVSARLAGTFTAY